MEKKRFWNTNTNQNLKNYFLAIRLLIGNARLEFFLCQNITIFFEKKIQLKQILCVPLVFQASYFETDSLNATSHLNVVFQYDLKFQTIFLSFSKTVFKKL